jgi:hypothetical protein
MKILMNPPFKKKIPINKVNNIFGVVVILAVMNAPNNVHKA